LGEDIVHIRDIAVWTTAWEADRVEIRSIHGEMGGSRQQTTTFIESKT